ncbi:hypothetical protein ACFFRR_000591 [Megaselia abdita]
MSDKESSEQKWRKVLRSGLVTYAKEGSKYFIKFRSEGRWGVYSKEFLKGRDYIFAFDRPHGEYVPYNHININPKISGIKDPHIPLTQGAYKASGNIAKGAEFMSSANKVLVPVAIAVDVARTGKSMYDDSKHNTTRNTAKTAAGIGGGWGGGFGGAASGAFLGTAICPGIGTMIGGFIGGISGGVGGSILAEKAVDTIGDYYEYNVVKSICLVCDEEFLIRLYLGEEKNNLFCIPCYYIQLYHIYMFNMS